MKKICFSIVLAFLSAMLSVQAADNMKAFPPAGEGMVRHVLQLPKQDYESAFKVELIAGKTVKVDEGNRYIFQWHDREGNDQWLGFSTPQCEQAGTDGGHHDGS